MTQEKRQSYWLQRFEKDSPSLTEEKRLELGRIRLTHIAGLQPSEIEIFINPTINPNTVDLDQTRNTPRTKVRGFLTLVP